MEAIIRKIDKLGRIVLPMDFRKTLGLGDEAKVVLEIEGTAITVRGANNACKLCGSISDVSNLLVCSECIRKIKNINT